MAVPWLSVIMPTYNGHSYLATALNSILVQHDHEIEVIAIDDGSDDDTLDILESYRTRLPLNIVKSKRTGSWVATTNVGISLARGEFLCCLHQDDIWLENRLRLIKRLLVAHPGAMMLIHPSWFIDGEGSKIGQWRCPLPRTRRCIDSGFLLERLLVHNFIAVAAAVFRREPVVHLGSLDEHLWFTADWDLWLRLAALGTTLYTPDALSCFRLHDSSQTVHRSIDGSEFRNQHETVLNRHLPCWKANDRRHKEVGDAARMSIEIDMMLAACFHGRGLFLGKLLARGPSLGLAGWHRCVRDSRIIDRVAARIRTGLLTRRAKRTLMGLSRSR